MSCADWEDFYPSIKETLLIKAIKFAEKLFSITNEDKIIIKQARKSLLCDNSEPWMKKDSSLFEFMQAGRNIPLIQTFSKV